MRWNIPKLCMQRDSDCTIRGTKVQRGIYANFTQVFRLSDKTFSSSVSAMKFYFLTSELEFSFSRPEEMFMLCSENEALFECLCKVVMLMQCLGVDAMFGC